jgi:hypothetical protein
MFDIYCSISILSEPEDVLKAISTALITGNYSRLTSHDSSPLALRSVQDPGLLQDQIPGVSIPSYFFQPLTPIFYISFSTLSSHLFLGFPTDPFPSGIFLNFPPYFLQGFYSYFILLQFMVQISKAFCPVQTQYITCTNNDLIILFSSPVSFRKITLIYLSFRFLNIWLVLRGGVVSPTPIPQHTGQGYPFQSGSSAFTCLSKETLPVATLPQA